MHNEDLSMKAAQTAPHHEFRRRAEECRRLAASARNAKDRAFWLGLVERWQAIAGESVGQPGTPCPPPRAGRAEWRPTRRLQASPNIRRQAASTGSLASNRRAKGAVPAAGGQAAGASSRSAKRRDSFSASR